MPIRIGMMLPGAVSLGAYEGGALAAILTAVQASDGALVIDAIASASAGSITGLVATRAILCGDDPIELMRTTWVDLPSLQNLERGAGGSAPLTMQGLTDTARKILSGPIDPLRRQHAQKDAVELSMALTALGGLTYSLVQQKRSGTAAVLEPLQATTYVDFYRARLSETSNPGDFAGHLEGALASGSTPVGFLPRQIDRSASIDEYKANGIVTPGNGVFKPWYSDGGDLDNQPLGRLLDLIAHLDGSTPVASERVIVMLNIEPGGPPTFDGTWWGTETPTWLSTLLHVNHIRSTQSLYDDLKNLEKTNQRIRSLRAIAGALGTRADDLVAGLAQGLDEQRGRIDASVHTLSGATTPGAPAVTTIEDVLLQAAGLAGKREIDVHVISPEIDPHVTLNPDRQLAGEFLFHFGGFFDVAFRQNDFSLGYRDAQYWLRNWLPQQHLANATAVTDAVDAGYAALPWPEVDEGQASGASLSLSEKLRAVNLLAHIGHVVTDDLAHDTLHAFESATDPHPHEGVRAIVDRHVDAIIRAARRIG